MSKKLYIRADMNQTIATGHVMRCLSIADAARKMDIDTIFISADSEPAELIKERGYQLIVLNSDWKHMEQEVRQLSELVKKNKIDKLLIDSYQVTEKYLMSLSGMTETVYIDDLNAFFYPVNKIVRYANYYQKLDVKYKYHQSQLMLGCSYAPLRKEFRNLPKKIIKNHVENLLIVSGGSDNFDLIRKILVNIDKSQYEKICAVCGRYYGKFEELCQEYASYSNIYFYKAVDNLIDYMKWADVVISAGGTTLYELCAVGTPTITYSFADNQLDNVHQFADDEIMDYAGDARYDDVYFEIAHILNKYKDADYRKNKSVRMQQLVDGRGAQRIVENIFSV